MLLYSASSFAASITDGGGITSNIGTNTAVNGGLDAAGTTYYFQDDQTNTWDSKLTPTGAGQAIVVGPGAATALTFDTLGSATLGDDPANADGFNNQLTVQGYSNAVVVNNPGAAFAINLLNSTGTGRLRVQTTDSGAAATDAVIYVQSATDRVHLTLGSLDGAGTVTLGDFSDTSKYAFYDAAGTDNAIALYGSDLSGTGSTVHGKIDLGNGDNSLSLISGNSGANSIASVYGDITGGTGADTISIQGCFAGSSANVAGIIGNINLGSGNNTITVQTNGNGQARIQGDLTFDTGASETGVINIVANGAGQADIGYGDITLGAGSDTVNITAGTSTGQASIGSYSAGAINLGGGTNTIMIQTTGNQSGSAVVYATTLTAGDGDNTFTLDTTGGSGTGSASLRASGAVNLGNGTHTLSVLSGASGQALLSFGSSFTTGSGADTLRIVSGGATASAILRSTDLGDGADRLVLDGSAGSVRLSLANKTLSMGAGDDSVTAAGNVSLSFATIALGSGDDTFDFSSSTAGAFNTVSIIAGAGNDTIGITNATGAAMTVNAIDISAGSAGETNTVTLADEGGGTTVTTLTMAGAPGSACNLTTSGAVTVDALDFDGSDAVDTLNVLSGTLSVGGGAGNLSFDAGDTLKGAGTLDIGSATFGGAGGQIRPGNAIGTLTIDGDLTISADTRYEIECSGTSSDKLVVTGATTIAAGMALTLAPVPTGTIDNGTSYTVLASTGGIANNGSIAVTQPANTVVYTFSLRSDAQNIFLDVARSGAGYDQMVDDGADNLLAVAVPLTAAAATASGDLRAVLDQLDRLPDTAALNAALGTMSPEPSAAATIDAGRGVGEAFMRTVIKRINAVRYGEWQGRTSFPFAGLSGAGGLADEERVYGLWGKSFNTWGEQKDAGSHDGFEYGIHGLAFGFDRKVGERFALGFSSGYAHTESDGKGTQGAASEINSLCLGLYGTYTLGRGFIDAGYAYLSNDNDSARAIAFGGLSRKATSDYDSSEHLLSVKYGYDFRCGNLLLVPEAGMNFSRYTQDAYAENGAGAVGLIVEAYAGESVQSKLGMRLGCFPQENLLGELRAHWVHEFNDDAQTVTASFAGIADTPFSVDGLAPESERFLFGMSLSGRLNELASLHLNYDAELRDDFAVHSVNAGFRISF